MELHHKLRRNPNWDPRGCNLCGQLGHQAAQCTTGTVDWRQMYGENVFKLKKAVFQSDIDALKKAKQINFAELEKRAKEYAKMREESAGKTFDDLEKKAQEMLEEGKKEGEGGGAAAATAAAGGEDGGAAAPAAQEKKEEKKPEQVDLPPGWAVAYDAQKRPYFWHTQTKKVQWDKPTKDTPIT